MINFIVVEKDSLDKSVVSSAHLTLSEPSIVHTKMSRDDVSEFVRDGNNLLLKLKNGKVIVIENFFVKQDDVASDLVFEEDDCFLFWFDGVSGFSEISGLEALLPAAGGSELGAIFPWLVGLGLGGGAIVASNSGSNSGGSFSSNPDGEITVAVNDKGEVTGNTKHLEPGSEVTLTIQGIGKDGEPLTQEVTTIVNKDGSYNAEVPADFVDGDLEVTAKTFDRNGNQVTDQDDLTKIDQDENPETPVQGGLDRTPGDIEVEVDAKGQITGTTTDVEPGSRVTLTIQGIGKDGEPLTQEVTTIVNKDGSYNAEVPADFVDGDLDVTAETFDRNGNPIDAADFLGGEKSQTIPGYSTGPREPEQGGLDRVDGKIEVTIDKGSDQFVGTTEDVAPGNPIVLVVTGQDHDGAPLTQYLNTIVKADGSYEIEIPADFADGDLKVDASTTDRNGNVVTDEDAVTLDRVDGSIEVEVDDQGVITGITTDVEPGSQVTLTIQGTGKDGEPLTQEITTTVNKDGSYNAEVPVDFVDGDLEVTATTFDRNGNLVTDQDDLTKTDHDENPETPVQGGLDRTPGDIEVGVDAKGQITGTTTDVEPGSQVTLTIQGTGKDGEPLTQEVTTTVNKDGSYNAEVPADFVDGELEVTATTFDRNGNLVTDQDDLIKIDHDKNPETPVQGGLDRTPGDIEVKVDVKGKIMGTTTDVEPGSQVTLTIQGTGKDGEPLTQEITTIVNKDGSYNAEVPADFVDGDLEVTATTFDRNGNQVTDQDDLTKTDQDENPETPVQGGLDRTPGDIEVKVDVKGKITGTTIDVEPGSRVTLTIQGTGKDGEPLTQEITTIVNKDGSYNAEVPADFVDGDLEVTAKTFDRNGNLVTDQDDLTKTDHDKNPETPVQGGLDRTPGDIEVKVGVKGKITGTTIDVEPGSQVTLTIQGTGKDGEPLTQEITTTVNEDGSYSAEVPADFVDGDLEVTATTFDRNGNLVTDQDDLTKTDHDENPETPVQGGLDRTPGDIEVKVDDKGKITGTTIDVEPGSQVTLTIQGTGKDGEPLTQEVTTTVNKDGSYNAEVPADFVDGELEVTATTFDRNGNLVTDQDDLTKTDHDKNPETPVQGGLDRTPGDIEVEVDAQGKITGTTTDVEPGSQVTLTIQGTGKDGEPLTQEITTTVNKDGSYNAEVPADFVDGDLEVTATTFDRNGNQVTDQDDLIKIDHDKNPETPVQGGLDRTESKITVSATEEGKITGTTKDVAPGSTVKLTITGQSSEGDEIKITTSAIVKEDGSYEAEYPVDADGTVVVTAETVDRNGYSINDHDSYELEVIRDDYQDPVIEIGTNDSDTLKGTSGNDLLIGDKGGLNTNFNGGEDYNVSIVIDLSGSMDYGISPQDYYTKRITIVKAGLKAFVQQMADHDGEINLQISTFSGDIGTGHAFSKPVSMDNIDEIYDYIDSLTPDSNTQPNLGFDKANEWFEEVSENGNKNQTYFLSDGNPSVSHDVIDKAFAPIAEKSAVYAVGISSDVYLYNVERYDNTDENGHKIEGDWDPISNHGVSQVFTKGDELISYLIGGDNNFAPANVAGDTIKAGAGDDIIFGDAINTNWIEGLDPLMYPKYSGYPALIAHLKAEVTNGEDPTDEQIYNFIKANYREFVNADAEDESIKGGDDIIYGGDGDDIIIAGAGDDRIYGGAGNDIISTGSGDDTIVYTLLQAADATGGNGTDTWIDYADNDKIEFSEDFFVGLLEDKSNIGDYIKLEEDDEGNAVLKVDRDGAQGDSHQWADLLVIENKTLDELDDFVNKQVVIG